MKTPKTIQGVKNSLKFKVEPKEGVLSIKIGVKKYNLPVQARIRHSDGFVFLSYGASSEIYKVDGGELNALDSESDGKDALAALTPTRRGRGRKKNAQLELPTEILEAFKKLPAGTKIAYNADGSMKLVRTRTRKKKSQA